MIIGTKTLLEMINNGELVTGLCERDRTNPEGAGFDLRLGEVYELTDEEGFLGETERKTPEAKLVAKYEEGKTTVFTMDPDKYYLVKTIEELKTPADIVPFLNPRSTLQRSGVRLFLVPIVAPGYVGGLTFGIKNLRNVPFHIELGARIAHVVFLRLEGEVHSTYRGQWQGGRVFTETKETQV